MPRNLSRKAELRGVLDALTREPRVGGRVLEQFQGACFGDSMVDSGSLGGLYQEQLAAKKSQQRASGSYFTPAYLVDFVVKHTLGALVRGRTPEQIKTLRILDPSCGGGAFLLGVLRFLEDSCVAAGSRSTEQLRSQLSACLVGVDLDPGAIAVSRAALSLEAGGFCRAVLLVGDALLPETEIPRVDAIVGNPPWGQKNLTVSAASRSRYRDLFVTAKGVWDPFKLFVERTHQLLSVGAHWGLVLPDIVLLKNLQEVRDVILEGSAIKEIAHCGRAFAGANIDAVVICAKRVSRGVGPGHRLRVWPALPRHWKEESPRTHKQLQAVFRELPGHCFNLYLHGPALDIYRRLRSLPRLGDYFEMHEGVHSGNSRARLFLSERGSGPARKLIVGRGELSAHSLCWGGRWLNMSPDAVNRSEGQYANLGRPSWHAPNKVVVRRTGDRVMAALDTQGYYVSNNLFVLLHTGAEPLDTRARMHFRWAVVALLNSRFMTWYFRAVQPRKGRLFAELKLVHLRDFPMPLPERWREVELELARLAKTAAHVGAEAVGRKIDVLVERAYELSCLRAWCLSIHDTVS